MPIAFFKMSRCRVIASNSLRRRPTSRANSRASASVLGVDVEEGALAGLLRSTRARAGAPAAGRGVDWEEEALAGFLPSIWSRQRSKLQSLTPNSAATSLA